MTKMLFLDGATGALQADACRGRGLQPISLCSFSSRCIRDASPASQAAFLSFMGLVVALLSATGIVIWFKKRPDASAAKAVAGERSTRARNLSPESDTPTIVSCCNCEHL